jgi:hypothetical protein
MEGRRFMKEKNPLRISHCRKTAALYLAAAALVCVLCASPLPAQFAVRPVNLAYLSRRADVIVQGQITSVTHKPLAGYPNIRTVEVTLSVERTLRGLPGKTYTFRELILGARSNDGKLAYRTGQRLLLFLPSPSQYGLSSPIGIGQGRFHIAADSAGSAKLANERGNAGLFQDVERDAVRAGKKLTPDERRLASTGRGPVPLEEFVSLVKSLTTLPRIQ